MLSTSRKNSPCPQYIIPDIHTPCTLGWSLAESDLREFVMPKTPLFISKVVVNATHNITCTFFSKDIRGGKGYTVFV